MIVASAVWGVCCLAGFGVLARYSSTAGASGSASASWAPPSAGVDDSFTLVLFAHPKCPCTSATFSELERLLASTDADVRTLVYFFEPVDAGDDWRDSRLWHHTTRIPNAEAHPDPGGRVADGAGAITSGTVALYDAGGERLFWGGITPGRGHHGDSAGGRLLRAVLAGEDAALRQTPIFGCAIRDPGACTEGGACDG